MAGNTFGKLFKLTTFGESHGAAIGGIIDGCPAGITLDFEAIQNDSSIEAIIPKNPSEREIKEIADNQGILNMKEDGIVKVLNGITSFSEVQSVVDFYEE